MIETLALFALSAAPPPTAAPPPLPSTLAVFVASEDPAAEHAAGRLEIDLTQALEKKGAKLVDLNALFPAPPPSIDEGLKLIKAGKDAYDNLDLDTTIKKLTDAALFFVN